MLEKRLSVSHALHSLKPIMGLQNLTGPAKFSTSFRFARLQKRLHTANFEFRRYQHFFQFYFICITIKRHIRVF